MRTIPFIFGLVLLATGCAGSRARTMDSSVAPVGEEPPRSHVETLRMSPFYFEGNLDGFDIYTDSDLFRRADLAYQARDFRHAYNIYRKLIEKFPESKYRVLAFYNAGLCLEQVGELERAVEFYLATEELLPPRAALLGDVLRHLGAVYERSEKWVQAEEIFRRLSEDEGISEETRKNYQSRIKVAAALARPESLEASGELADFVRDYRQYLRTHPEFDNSGLARAQFSLGQVHFERFRAIRLESVDRERLEADLEQKAAELLRAQSHFMRTLQIRNAEWATAAVYRLGLAYEEFYDELNHAPLPHELNEVEQEVYREELRLATEPVRGKAITAYEKIISFADSLSLRSDWVERARRRKEELLTAGKFLDTERSVEQDSN